MNSSPASSTGSSSTSVSLVTGLRDGQSEAWERLVEIYAPLVRCWCRFAGVADHRIPDILQEVFVSVHRSVDRFQPRDSTAGFRGWIWMITRNKIRDHFREIDRHPAALGGSSAQVHFHQLADHWPEDPPSEPADHAAMLHRAMEYVRVEFREQPWNMFWRATVLGQSNQQIADELSTTTAAVRQAKSRVLRRLRQQLGDVE